MTDNKLIEQDWEFELQKDKIYFIERQRDIELSWQEKEKKFRLPAKIRILNFLKNKKHEYTNFSF